MKRSEQLQMKVIEKYRKFREPLAVLDLWSGEGAEEERRRKKVPIDGEIGLELEMEGQFQLTDTFFSDRDKTWKIVEEGSLRNGMEFITRQPFYSDRIDEVLDALSTGLHKTQPSQSIRTSLHCHINVLEEKIADVFKIIGTWWLIENLLVEINGKERIGNLFCLRVMDAEDITEILMQIVNTHNTFWDVNYNTVKYGAQNIGAIQKYGSLEYRFMKGYTEPKDIKKWALGLLNFHRVVVKQFPSLMDVIRFMETSDPAEFLHTFLTEELFQDVYKTIDNNRIHQMMMENFCHTYRLAISLEKEFFLRPRMNPVTPENDEIDFDLQQEIQGRVKYDIKARKNANAE